MVLTKAELTSSPPFQLPTPDLPNLKRASTLPVSTRRALEAVESLNTSSTEASSSPAQDTSPSLPPLPPLPRGPLSRSATFSSPPQQRSESTYYTALWGSPYDLPSSSRASQGSTALRRRDTVATTDGSPLRPSVVTPSSNTIHRHLKNDRLPQLSPTSDLAVSSPSVGTSANIGHQRYDLTGDWIRNYKQERIERRIWFSDESGGSGSDSEVSVFGETKEESTERALWSNLRTPRASQLNRLVLREKPANSIASGSASKHHQQETLTQKGFDNIVRSRSERASRGSKMLSALMSGGVTRRDRRSSASEKPLPAAPLNRTASEAPVSGGQAASENRPAPPLKRPSISSMSSFLTPKKTITWRGKKCIITLPLEVAKGSDGKPKVPLTPEEVAARIRQWEEAGYSNRGFDLTEELSGAAAMGQSRGIYPDATDFGAEAQTKKFTVRIPNKKEFEDYKNQLAEEKLRALGVTRGDEPPARASPDVSAMSRQASSQNSYPPSLSSGPSAPNQFRSPMENTFSPPLTAPNPQFPFSQPLVSPGAVPQNPRSAGFHAPTQSIAFQPGQGGYSVAPFQQQVHAMSAQQPYLGSVPSSRGVSPLIDAKRQNLQVSNSPISPLPAMATDGYFNRPPQLPPSLRQQANPLHPAAMQQHLSQPQKFPLQRQISDNLNQQQPMRFVSQPDIASPLPQGHRHNVSESLQKEIDEAEYHLEESIARQLEDEDSASKPKDREATVSEGRQETMSEEESLDRRTAPSDIATNPSVVSSPLLGSAGLPSSNAHTPKISGSKLNVKAQEFKFDPTKSFTSMFTFGDRSNTASGPTSATSFSGPDAPHSAKTSNASTFSSSLNVAAPAFVPGQVQSQHLPLSNREFSFSSKLPGSRPSGLSSTPGYAFNSSASNDVDEPAQAARIFSDVVQPLKESKAIPIVKPEERPEHDEDESGRIGPAAGREKRMRRHNSSGDEVPLFAAMPKEIPSMPKPQAGAEPQKAASEPKEEQLPERQAPKISTPQPVSLPSPNEKPIDDPLNTADFLDAPTNPATPSTPAEKATDQLKALVEDIDAESTKPEEGPQVQGPIEDPFAVGDHEDEGATDKSRQHSRPASPKAISEEDRPETIPNGKAVTPKETTSELSTLENKSTLSATAKPFSFNPAVMDFKPTEPDHAAPTAKPPPPSVETVWNTPVETPEPPKQAPKKSALLSGLGASKYAMQQSAEPPGEPSPPMREASLERTSSLVDKIVVEVSSDSAAESERNSIRESSSDALPEATLSTSSHKDSPKQPLDERIIQGVSYVEPESFEELDNVMQQLNGDDSDAGVERNPIEAWRSPVRRATDEHQHTPTERYAEREYVSDVERRLQRSSSRITASPNRLAQPFQYLPAQEVDMSDSAADAAAEYVARNPRDSPSFKKPRRSSASYTSPVHRLNRVEDDYVSDWDDVVSAGEEEAFNQRVGFFDNRVSRVITNAIEDRLQPLETALASLTAELSRKSDRSRSRRYQRSASADVEHSDADDEDDEVLPGRALSPFMKDRKFEKLRALLLEAVSSQRPAAADDSKVLETLAELKTAISRQQQEPETSKAEMGDEVISKLTEAIGDLKASLAAQSTQPAASESSSTDQLANVAKAIAQLQVSINEQKDHSESQHGIKAVIEDAITRHMKGRMASGNSGAVRSAGEGAAVEKLQLQVNGLESMLKIQESRANDEYKQRREVEDELAENQRELNVALAEAAQSRDAAEETEASLRSFLDDQQQSKQHLASLEEVQVSMEKSISDLTEKNNALEETISEYRISHNEWRKEMDEAKVENGNLQRTISALKEELEEGIRSKQTLRAKLERLQEDVIEASRKIAVDQSAWRHKEEEHKAKHELSSARLEAEARTRERLELEIERLEKQEREAMKARFLVEQIRGENSSLSAIVNDLRTKSHHHQERSMAIERELHDTKERTHLEIQRITNLTKGDVEAANQQVQIVRSNLEASISRVESQLEAARDEAKLAKDRHELMLEEASFSKDNALREAAEAREAALQEHYRFHERTLNETTSSHDRAMNELKSSHEHAFATVVEDHQRKMSNLIEDHKRALDSLTEEKRISEQDFTSRLALFDDKLMHLQDKVAHLTERLSITQSAAQAAATAARSVRSSTPQPSTTSTSLPSMLATRDSTIPDKISPQALRESILVLQEQLHERESRIERLEADLAVIDHDAPQKIKERDIEITWLRELLGVRFDDLQDIISSLSSPTGFDREAVLNATIRLRANLQMEQQEKERAMASGGASQRLPSLSSLAASPRSLPLAAAAAWGNWRKGQTSLSSLAEMAVPSVAGSANQTPSKSSPQSFLSGLLTPPSTNVRHTPQPPLGSSTRPQSSRAARTGSVASASQQRRPLAGYSTPKRQISGSLVGAGLIPPETPTLLRQQSYDPDADEKDHHYSLDRYVTEPPEDEGEAISEASAEASGADDMLEQGKGKGKELERSGLSRMDTPQELFGPSIELES